MSKRASYHFLHFTKKEKNGTVFFLFVILLLIGVPFFYTLFFSAEGSIPNYLAVSLDSLKAKSTDSSKKYSGNFSKKWEEHEGYKTFEKKTNSNIYEAQLFYFDPNELPASGWQKLGVKDKTIATIQNYLSKGGRFRKAADIKKIWGLHEGQVQRLIPFVKIRASDKPFQKHQSYEIKNIPEKKAFAPIDINNADSTALDELPGIGIKLSHRIITFREKLGGFYSVNQVAETYGLPDSTFRKIKNRLVLNDNSLRKININIATLDEMKLHPYIRYQLANAIVQFRLQHGAFSQIEDIKRIMMMNDELYSKLVPYLAID